MVKHIVLFQVKEGYDVAEVTKIAREALLPLVGKIEGLTHVQHILKSSEEGLVFCDLFWPDENSSISP